MFEVTPLAAENLLSYLRSNKMTDKAIRVALRQGG